MQRGLLAILTAALVGACSAPPPHAVAPTGPAAPEHGETARRGHARGGHDGGGMHHGFADADAWAKVFDDPARDAWQHPEDVLQALELAPAMTVADVGAGTGYFAVRLARAVPAGEVIATDVEPDMVRHLDERARREELGNLRAVRASASASGLAAQSVDRVLVVHVWHHLADRVAYARDLAAALRPGGKVVIVDFTLAARRGPPASHRLAPEAIVADLTAAGLAAKVSPITLPDQYIVEGRRP
ncbi:MAG: class I SAM-dependent methyltransferase [Labilithrix sp.]|nr:class I SAM-dependent methyltransferase [Labilithrix sp.]